MRGLYGLLRQGHRVYVHGTAGINRSPLVVLAYLTLLLRGYGIETTTTGIPFNRYYSQTIAVALADLFVAGQQAGVNMLPCISGQFIKMFFFFFVRYNNLFQFALFGG